MPESRGLIKSFNAGYHRGLNTEYHDEDPKDLFAGAGSSDFKAFHDGYQEGLDDYGRMQAELEEG